MTLSIRLFLYLFFTFCLFTSTPAYSQTPTAKQAITGQLLDAQTQETLPFATVRAFSELDSSLQTGQTTDTDGKFTIAIAPGSYYLLIDFVGYKTRTISDVQVVKGIRSVDLGALSIKPNTELLEEVEVVAEKMDVEYQLDKRVYNVAKATTMIGSSASQLLDNLPSVEVDVVEGTISLRGSSNVRILIDGKPAALSGMSSADALRNLQSDIIERVEVVTNPSARYDAEGEAGVINIVLKKDRKKGVNGSFSLDTGIPTNFGLSANLNYRKKDFNFFGSYGVRYRKYPGYGLSTQRFFEEDTSYYYERNREHTRGGLSNNLRVGMDYYLTPSFTITGALTYNTANQENNVDLEYLDFSEEGILGQEVIRNQLETETKDNWSLGLSLKKTFKRKGQEWSFDWQFADEEDLEMADLFEQNLTFANVDDITQRSSNTEDQQNWLLQSSYVHPFGKKGQFETGFRGTHRLIENVYLVEQLGEEGKWSPLADFNNDFAYLEDIYAGYAIIGNNTEKISWQLGLRGEYTFISTELKVTNDYNEQEYFNLFPSGHLSYKFSKENSLQLSYSRRLSRPRFRLLLPFSNFSDSRNFRAGNPTLRPEFTDSFEIGMLQNWDTGSLLSSVYYRYRTNVIQRVTTVDENDFTTSMPVNLSFQHAVGFEFSWSQDISEWWTLSANANLYREQTEGSFEGQDLSAEAFTMNGRATSKMKLAGNLDFQTTFRYSAPRNSPQGSRKSLYVVDLGLSKEIWQGKGTVSFAVQDLLNSRKWRSITEFENYYAESEFQWRARQIVFSLNYRLNQQKGRGGKRGDGDGNGGGGGDGGF